MNKKDLLQQSHSQKLFANTLFSSSHYSDAISKYEQALSLCPNYLDYEIAILKSDIAACFIKLEYWKAAVDSATEVLDRLERILLLPPSPSSSSSPNGKEKEEKKIGRNDDDDDGKAVEITVEGRGGSGEQEVEEEAALAALRKRDEKKADVQRIRAKALLRRARAKSELGGWANLQAAHEGMSSPSPSTSFPSLPSVHCTTPYPSVNNEGQYFKTTPSSPNSPPCYLYATKKQFKEPYLPYRREYPKQKNKKWEKCWGN